MFKKKSMVSHKVLYYHLLFILHFNDFNNRLASKKFVTELYNFVTMSTIPVKIQRMKQPTGLRSITAN